MQPPSEPAFDAAGFAGALLDPDAAVPASVGLADDRQAGRRFAIYRNNVTVGLIDALGEIFPTVKRLVGADFFNAMARAYLRQHPPLSPLIFEYGQSFATFLEAFAPARHLGYLPDVARLERHWLDAFHACDDTPLPAAALAAIAPEELMQIRLRPHPATRLMASPWAIASILNRDRAGERLTGIDPATPEFAIVTRPHFDVKVIGVGAAAFRMIEALAAGRSLGDAAATALATEPNADLPAIISCLLSAGAFSAITPAERERLPP